MSSTTESRDSLSSLFRIEQLRDDNWLPWKRRTMAILRERGVLKYVDGTSEKPKPANATTPTAGETAVITKWVEGDQKAQTVIELLLSDSQMIHIADATTAAEMWNQLKLVKEASGQLGIMAYRRKFYRTVATEGSDIAAHITELRRTQEQLHMMGSKVSDDEFRTILITSLPESWDQFTSAYLGATSQKDKLPTSHELIAILLEEYRRRREKGGADESALAACGRWTQPKNTAQGGTDRKSDAECWNCHKRGHTQHECWSKGGGKAGQGPRSKKEGRAQAHTNQAQSTNDVLRDVAFRTDEATCAGQQFSSQFSRYDWLADSGTTSHVTNLRDTMTDYVPLEASSIAGIGDQSVRALGRGTVEVNSRIRGNTCTFCLKDVLYAPKATNNLVSLSRLDEAGGHFDGGAGGIMLRESSGHIIAQGRKVGRLYLLNMRAKAAMPSEERANIARDDSDSWESWHRRYGHLGFTGLEKLYKENLVEGLTVDENSMPLTQCEACVQAKQARRAYPKEVEDRSQMPGELTHSDVWGPARVVSIAGSHYYISFTDDCTQRCQVLFMKHKSEAFEKLKEYLTFIERRFGHLPKIVRVDNGSEYINKNLKGWCREKGIELQTTAPYSPSQNGVAERFNRTLLELARAMLIARKLPNFLWAEAVAYAAYLRNRAPTKALCGKTPEEAWTGKKPNVAHLREFGSDVWILTEGQNLSKLEPKSKKHTFVGFADGPKAVRYYDVGARSIRVSRNFVFADALNPASNVPVHQLDDSDRLPLEGESGGAVKQQPPTSASKPASVPVKADQSNKKHDGNYITEEDLPPEIQESMRERPTFLPAPPKIPLRRTTRATQDHDYRRMNNPRAQPTKSREPPGVPKENAPGESAKVAVMPEEFEEIAQALYATALASGDRTASAGDEPRSLAEAQASPEWPEWEKAVKAEYDQLQGMGTWELQDLPKDRNAVGCKWVFQRKTNKEGQVVKYKARLVAQGYSQIPGMDFLETFAPVVRLESIRAILALAVVNNWEIGQMDVKGAYLNGDLQEEIYMRQPEGFDDGSGRICRLRKTLYGLKQSGREWNRKLHRELTELGYKRLEADPCVYLWERKEGEVQIITVWVDDLLLFTNSPKLMEELKRDLQDLFEVTDLGEPQKIVGIEIERDREAGKIQISQQHYIESILKRYQLENANAVGMPLDPNVAFTAEDENEEADDRLAGGYASMVGSLMYAAVGTRPDISYAVQTLSKYTACPRPVHWTAAKRVLRYLAGTRDLHITYTRRDSDAPNGNIIGGYTDTDYASDHDRKSVSGHVFYLGGGAVAWSSKKQTTTATSSTEAEYTALAHATRQAIWLRNLLAELGFAQEEPTEIYCDNQAAIAIARDPQYHARSKHFDVQNHFVREKVENGIIQLCYCPTDEMVADVFTKALPKPKHQKFTLELGMLPA
ncbi:hypothetical protein SCP_1002700 [Sparassis crispa]|uniref:Retrovirus-related Pol polyprotein from transposon TNT 1-94 n=1 Tax=Sparassis crispa TaxID=139825 RepID=A0A401GYH9_9APHY|nr:hypothetical protein SCP_1002700 [Sparassis crispa]GBE87024.1 hypothetical protein SCP_1002700 [Sparassis crispa]